MGSQLSKPDVVGLVVKRAATEMSPALTTPDVEDIVDRSAVADDDGNLPADDDWTPTYDVNRATAEAWEEKAAQVANRFDIQIDNQGLTRSQLHAHFMAQAEKHRARSAFVWPV